jgi:hypothetical protein
MARSFVAERNLLILGLATLATVFATNALADQAGPAIRGRTSNEAGAVFQFDASAADANGSDITIRCIEKCRKNAPVYREHVDAAPTSVTLPKDGSTRFISVWTTGSAYRVMVHDIAGPKVEKVMEHGSRIPPSAMGIDDKGEEFFVLCDEDHGCNEFHWRSWVYEVIPRKDYHWTK